MRAKINSDMATRCELALMGKVVEVHSKEEVNAMTRYILSAIGHADDYKDLDMVKDRICRYSENNEVKYLVCNTILGHMKCITYLLASTSDDEEETFPAPFEEDYGTGTPCSFCYVFNTDADDGCSEFGDCFFQKRADGFYHSVS